MRRPPRSTPFPYTTLFRSILVVNKVDRPDARIAEVVDEVYALFLDLDADESQIEFPIVYANARAGQEGLHPRSEEHTSELQSPCNLVCRHLREKNNHARKH